MLFSTITVNLYFACVQTCLPLPFRLLGPPCINSAISALLDPAHTCTATVKLHQLDFFATPLMCQSFGTALHKLPVWPTSSSPFKPALCHGSINVHKPGHLKAQAKALDNLLQFSSCKKLPCSRHCACSTKQPMRVNGAQHLNNAQHKSLLLGMHANCYLGPPVQERLGSDIQLSRSPAPRSELHHRSSSLQHCLFTLMLHRACAPLAQPGGSF